MIVDEKFAARTARELVPAARMPDTAELDELVTGLKDNALTAQDLVLDSFLLDPAHADEVRTRLGAGSVLVLDQLGWIKANAQSLNGMVDVDSLPAPVGPGSAKAAAVELAGVLSLLSTRVLGQFDPFAVASGRLMFVAPAVLIAEEAMNVSPRDFRMWVALHEATHQVQFATAPWLREHMRSLLSQVVATPLKTSGFRGIPDVFSTVGRIIKGEASMVDLIRDEGMRSALDEASAILSLLEGHADVVMDEVGIEVIPSVRKLRRKFEARRDAGQGGFLSNLLGMNLKLAQYRDGAAFVRAIRREVGQTGFSAIYASPENLPTSEEIATPSLWLDRVHG
ncbi:MAG: zinc-dependent metalloprotease [Brevibacterium sp.]|uniref:zinc-dependent metalloprotease n=1 Tax=Brevibacterium sp. TaxID=1701 RepID=UPI002648FD7F|nr:zinc-dependent metalloprotease [Brevibacterium sp.]MDN5806616.1 zinc-dependent metalloprotease [Brevibacterium sp.]MDN5833706.1 zinc-dependent metalloprotease [Brevibacterium sp.]MDN5875975.1 zinc-dependent metalloprotease [Brevibacterium sp.]MDN5910103.1 zinc-dependent metalloprotease [Brevibacterium sp.]MDN6133501.1 zinc-dependent metalloprotease [Brevibacterium sp.]